MKLAREPASSCPKPYASPNNAPRILPVRRILFVLVEIKQTGVRDQFSHRNAPRLAPLLLAQRGSALLWLVDDRAALYLPEGSSDKNTQKPGFGGRGNDENTLNEKSIHKNNRHNGT